MKLSGIGRVHRRQQSRVTLYPHQSPAVQDYTGESDTASIVFSRCSLLSLLMSRLNSALLNLQTSVNQQHELANKSARAQVKEEKGEEKQSHRTNKKEEDEDGDDASSSSDDDSAPSHPGVDDSAPILVYCRIRPARNRANTANGLLTVDDETKKVEFKIPKQMDTNSGTVNNTKESFDFNFSGIFGEKTTQEEMFNGIGKRVVDNVLAGYNGQIYNAHEVM